MKTVFQTAQTYLVIIYKWRVLQDHFRFILGVSDLNKPLMLSIKLSCVIYSITGVNESSNHVYSKVQVCCYF